MMWLIVHHCLERLGYEIVLILKQPFGSAQGDIFSKGVLNRPIREVIQKYNKNQYRL